MNGIAIDSAHSTCVRNSSPLVAVAEDAWPHGEVGEWPIDAGEGGNGTSGVVAAVTQGTNTIGYADASQVSDLGTVAVGVGEDFVEYSPEAAAAVVESSPSAEGRPEGSLAL